MNLCTKTRTGDESDVWAISKPDLVLVDVFDDGSVVILIEKNGKREVIEAFDPTKK